MLRHSKSCPQASSEGASCALGVQLLCIGAGRQQREASCPACLTPLPAHCSRARQPCSPWPKDGWRYALHSGCLLGQKSPFWRV